MIPGSPLITDFWQLVLVLAAGIGVIAVLHRIIRHKIGRNDE
ncbi:MAG TPA: hypothetical protein PLJ34_04170 [Hyphomicrobiales bacterium]|mgnify:FL=1|nr:hypothetical protein [Hyphomicrobiales bacterium]